MPGLDRRIDPDTGDYIDDGAGGDLDTDTIETAAYHQIKTHRGEYWADPTKGSDLHLVPRMSLDQALEFAPDTIKACLQALVDAGLAKDLYVEVTTDPNVPYRLIGLSEITDAQKGAIDLSQIAGLTS